MNSYWVEYFLSTTPKGICVDAVNEDVAKEMVEKYTGGEIRSASILPYPATPRMNNLCGPAFCFSPETCKGNSSCPRRRACSE